MKIEECQIYEIVKNSLPIGFTLVDDEGVIVDFNPAHCEKIWVKSTPGEGSTFSFTLPKGER